MPASAGRGRDPLKVHHAAADDPGMRGRCLCLLVLVLLLPACGQSGAGSTPPASSGHPANSGPSGTTPVTTIENQIGPPTTPPQAVRRVRVGMTQAAVQRITGFPEQAARARRFSACWIYQNTSGVAFVCFRHQVVAFKTGPSTYTKALRALNRAASRQ